jgi:Flp pilus assembly protein TadD
MPQRSVECLMADVNFAIERGLGARDLIPMLRQLLRSAPVGSVISRYARLHLGRLLLESEPFRAAALARSVALERLQAHEDDAGEAFGLLGLALTLLGHFRAATAAQRRACQLAPGHPGHAHNLGHLLDAGLGRPAEALFWLERAFRYAPDVPGIASSYAHALVGVGRVEQARTILRTHGRLAPELADAQVSQWLTPSFERECDR